MSHPSFHSQKYASMTHENPVTLPPNRVPKRWAFSLSTLLFLITTLATAFAWWSDRSSNQATVPKAPQYDVPGPLFVAYTLRKSPNTTAGQQHTNALGINFRGDNIVVHTQNGGVVLTSNSLIELIWKALE